MVLEPMNAYFVSLRYRLAMSGIPGTCQHYKGTWIFPLKQVWELVWHKGPIVPRFCHIHAKRDFSLRHRQKLRDAQRHIRHGRGVTLLLRLHGHLRPRQLRLRRQDRLHRRPQLRGGADRWKVGARHRRRHGRDVRDGDDGGAGLQRRDQHRNCLLSAHRKNGWSWYVGKVGAKLGSTDVE